jgi:hypothetical protein
MSASLKSGRLQQYRSKVAIAGETYVGATVIRGSAFDLFSMRRLAGKCALAVMPPLDDL